MSAWPGFFVCVEGPSGVGKSTLIEGLVAWLNDNNWTAIAIKQPSSGPIGSLARQLTDTLRGHSLACLVAADRYHQLETEILPALARGHVVVCDRYVPSSLVLQCADDVSEAWVDQLNKHAPAPDLYLFLSGDPGLSRGRSRRRGPRDRFHQELSGAAEARRYRAVADLMHHRGHAVVSLETAHLSADEVLGAARANLVRRLGKRPAP